MGKWLKRIAIGCCVLVMALAVFLVPTIWGKPWSVKGLFTRTFLKFALRGPELLTSLGILAGIGVRRHEY